MQWTDLIRLDPRLSGLLVSVRRLAARRASRADYCANDFWCGEVVSPWSPKERLCRLVGWERKSGPRILQTPAAYDVAYDTLYAALPACKQGVSVYD